MFKQLLRIITISLVALLPLLFVVTPAYAISDPDSIAFGCGSDTNMYQVFQNVYEDGDMLFVAETDIHYNIPPTDYSAQEAFLFEVVDTDGTTVIQSTPILEYEAYLTSIYFSDAQVTSFGLVWESAYAVRLTGNPAIFGTPVEGTNKVTATLVDSDYITDTSSGVSVTGLRIFCLSIAEDLQDHDSPANDYYTTVQGVDYLTTTGGNIFIAAIPGLGSFCPSLFQTTTSIIEIESEEPTGAYAETLAPLQQLGPTINNGITNFADWFGMSTTMAGVVIMFVIMLVLCGYAYVKTQNLLLPDAIAMALPLLGAQLGLVPLAMAFTVTIVIALITLYYFFTRGAL